MANKYYVICAHCADVFQNFDSLGQMIEFIQKVPNINGCKVNGEHFFRLHNLCVEPNKEQEFVTFSSGASSSKIPHFEDIPYRALVRVAERFELGKLNHKEKAWNARQNHQSLLDKEWVIARAAHVINHAFKYISKLEGLMPDDGDDDASAITWGGICLSEAQDAMKA